MENSPTRRCSPAVSPPRTRWRSRRVSRCCGAGGTAADAAVAVQAMLGLVEPQSSGVGGGGFLLYYDAASHKVSAYDGRETAPKAATPAFFLDGSGKPLPFPDAVTSGLSTGVPGAMPMLGLLQQQHGTRAWASLFDPAIRAAQDGFATPQRLARFVNASFRQAELDPKTLFVRADGSPLQAGDLFRNPAYAKTPAAAREPGSARVARIAHCGRDRRAAPAGAAARQPDDRRSRGLSATSHRRVVRAVPRLRGLRAAAAVERRRVVADAGDPRAHGHRPARPG